MGLTHFKAAFLFHPLKTSENFKVNSEVSRWSIKATMALKIA